MKFRTAPNIWHLLGIGLLLTILTASYLMGRPIDSDVHARILDHGRSLIEANAYLDEQIVLLRSGLLRHYDPVNETVDNLRRRSAALGIELSKIAGQSTQAIAQALEGVRAAVNAKEEQVERFKSTNALLQNSLMYFSMAAQQLIVVADHTVAGTPITRTTGTLVARMLAYTRAPHEQNTELVRQSLAALEGLALPPKFAQDARLLAQHARAVLDLAPATNSALSNLLAMDVAKRARELLSVYLDQYAAAEQQTQIYRRGSYAVSILLVFYLIFLFARLQTSAQALTRANRALSTQKERAEKTLHAIADGVIATDARGVVTDVNTVAEELTGYGQGEAVGRNVRDILHLVDKDGKTRLANPVAPVLQSGTAYRTSQPVTLLSKFGTRSAVEVSVAPIGSDEAGLGGAVLVVHNVTQTQELISRISHEARHDSLTGLRNRSEFEQLLAEAIRGAKTLGDSHMLAYLDLDQFKVVNDTCGHVAGDELLKQLSTILLTKVRTSDILARLGGDEFGLLLQGCGVAQGQEIAEKLLGEIRDFRFSWKGHSFDVGASIGLVPIMADVVDVAEALSHADIACYAAKDLGRNRIHVHTPDDSELVRRHSELQWVSEIRRSLEEDGFELYCQPILKLDARDRPATHFEILTRYRARDGELVLPGAFIPAAERYNLMGAIDRWVIATVFAGLGNLTRSNPGAHDDLLLTINLSGDSINDPSLRDYVLIQAQHHRLNPRQICFEITETKAISNLQRTVPLIETLRGAGFRFALDDFGSGLSSFGYLKTLPVDFLKIDGSFVKDIVEDTLDHAFVSAINTLGHVMGKTTIAEYVEGEAIAQALQKLGVDFGQGFGLGRPIPLREAIPGLSRGRAPDIWSSSADAQTAD